MQTLKGWKRMYQPAQKPANGNPMKMSASSQRMLINKSPAPFPLAIIIIIIYLSDDVKQMKKNAINRYVSNRNR